MNAARTSQKILTPALIVAALGYFVDTFDIVIFSIVRVASLTELGLSGEMLVQKGLFLLNMQLIGMLIGGVLWGVLGDKLGRSSTLMMSILCYSIANIANGFVTTVETYALCRFISGVGLAGELGAAVTLIMEGLPTKKRGMGALGIIFVGLFGAVTAASFGSELYWRHLYFLGGGMGLVLLFARSMVHESELFLKTKGKNISTGNLFKLFKSREKIKQFVCCFMIGVPHVLFWAVMITLSPEISKEMGITVSVPILLTTYAVCLAFGDMSAMLFSQVLGSRRKSVLTFLTVATFSFVAFYAIGMAGYMTSFVFYITFAFLGFFAGYSLMIPVIAAESFGTNLRVTATSTITNFVRGSGVVLNLGVAQLAHLGLVSATQIIGAIVMIIALLSAYYLKETFYKDMDFLD